MEVNMNRSEPEMNETKDMTTPIEENEMHEQKEPFVAEVDERIPFVCVTNVKAADISDLSLTFFKGGIHGILAPKGSGKTLITDLISGVERPEQGSITVGGKDLLANPNAAKKKLGYVPQESVFFDGMTVSETMNFIGEARLVPAEKRYRQIKEAMDLLGIDGIGKRLIRRLSTAELKRLAIAAALLGNPDLLVMDEPIPQNAGEGKQAFLDLIRMLGRIKTIVLATSDIELARSLCEDVVILSDGKILAQGTFEELDAKLRRNGDGCTLESIYAQLCAASREEPLDSDEENKDEAIEGENEA